LNKAVTKAAGTNIPAAFDFIPPAGSGIPPFF